MNSLSWLIYLADRVGIAVAIFGLLSLVSVVFYIIMSIQMYENWYTRNPFPKFISLGWMIPIPLILLTIVIPSKNALYMIAASEAGETIVQSPEAKEIFNKMKTIIGNSLDEILKEGEKK